jgi:hypothetical protein
MFTADPTKPSSVATVSPAWMPIPTGIGAPPAAVLVSASWRMRRPQRTAALGESKAT